MASKPCAESRSLYPCARKEIELSRSKMRKGMEARRRHRASKREPRPAPEMSIGFRVFMGMVMMLESKLSRTTIIITIDRVIG